jgi:hypothetical protein
VEDDSSTYRILTMAFEEAVPEIETRRAFDGDQALSMLREIAANADQLAGRGGCAVDQSG